MKIWYLLLLNIVVINSTTNAQIVIKSEPLSNSTSLRASIPEVIIPNILFQLSETSDKAPVQAGYTLPVDDNILEYGHWESSENLFVWRLSIVVPEANAVNLYFNNIHLSDGERLFLYDPQKSITLGAFTSINNGSFMCTDFIPGDKIIIEFNSFRSYKQLPFSIHEAGILLGNYENNIRGFGDAGYCEVFVNCVEGENWQNEKGGVARILVKQSQLTFWCTGSLVNNTKNDGIPYFLTANHCGELSDSTDYSQWLFYFNFESENCDQPLYQPELHTLSGSSLLASSQSGTSNSSDFKLLLLNDDVPLDYKPYYNGWDRSGVVSQSGVTIHHPQGDLKMISTYTTPLLSTKYNNQNENPDGMYWMVGWVETVSGHGVTEGGSSGSPIFNNEHNIVGALTGGGASCDFVNEPDYYGKFSYSWESTGQDSTTQLKYWLDPIETGVTILKGSNLDSTNIFAGFSGEPTTVILGESATFISTSIGNISGYNWYFKGGSPEYSELEEPGNIQYNKAGAYDVWLVVSSADGADTLVRKDYITVLPNLSPNPSNGKVKIVFGDKVPDEITIRIFDLLGRETGYRKIEKIDNYLNIDLGSPEQGLYFIMISSEKINNTYKVVVAGY